MEHLEKFRRVIDGLNEAVGRAAAWLVIIMVLVQFVVVVLRYVFGFGSIMMQESVVYLHGILFMLGAGYTLLLEGHVRVDIFYREATPGKKALVDLFGALLLLGPVCVLIWWSSWSYVEQSWRIFEGSKETSGIHAVYVLKTAILAFALLMFLQGLSMAARSYMTIKGVDATDGDDAPCS
ncbi:MAG: TRAP transporter small permease subunit [Alphaproteobacteria bacterium]